MCAWYEAKLLHKASCLTWRTTWRFRTTNPHYTTLKLPQRLCFHLIYLLCVIFPSLSTFTHIWHQGEPKCYSGYFPNTEFLWHELCVWLKRTDSTFCYYLHTYYNQSVVANRNPEVFKTEVKTQITQLFSNSFRYTVKIEWISVAIRHTRIRTNMTIDAYIV